MSKGLMVGYGLMGLGAIVMVIAISTVSTIVKVAVVVGAAIVFAGYKIRLYYR